MQIFLRKYGTFLAGIACLLSIAVILSVVSNRFFTLTTIEVVGQDMQLDIDKEKLPQNVLFFPTDTISAELLRQYPVLSGVRITKKYPHTIVLTLTTRQPIAMLVAKTGNIWVSVGGYHTGEPAEPAKNLPTITANVAAVPLGRPVNDDRIIHALAVLQALGDTLLIDHIDIIDESTIKASSNNTLIYFRNSQNIAEQVATLTDLVSGLRVKGTAPKKIDLRFSKPIVEF